MMGGLDGARRMMERETLKPKNVSATLARFWAYFRPYWFALLSVAVLIVVTVWTYVTAPELMGQAVDCYLFPRPGSVCWYTSVDPNAAIDVKIAGLLNIVVALAALYLAGSLLRGLLFYIMNWAGQSALKEIRKDVFRHVSRLSLRYYAENEAGNIMSRFTSDSETIQQARGFALVLSLIVVLMIDWVVM